ncbi:MAG: SOS response-associated peptidase, partial [Methanobacteriota archaeon]
MFTVEIACLPESSSSEERQNRMETAHDRRSMRTFVIVCRSRRRLKSAEFPPPPHRSPPFIDRLFIPARSYTAHMCGRFTIAVTVGWEARFKAKRGVDLELRPRYNVAPSQQVPIIADDPEEPGSRSIVPMRWGLVPSWAKDTKTGYSMINARAEGLTSSPAYRGPVRHRRCLVPATGFYEWKQEGSRKLPFYIDRRDHQLFAMAGLYDIWHGADAALASFTIV